jgi:hypothetical protein
MKDILLFDRVKELTHITGTSDILLEGAANGFSAFADYYSVNDAVFYAITDGVQYEVGSGEYLGVITPNTTTLTRNSLRRLFLIQKIQRSKQEKAALHFGLALRR